MIIPSLNKGKAVVAFPYAKLIAHNIRDQHVELQGSTTTPV
jgi:hypothetical protein